MQLDSVRKMCAEVLEPAHFFIAAPIILEWEYRSSETISWEIHRGRLLGVATGLEALLVAVRRDVPHDDLVTLLDFLAADHGVPEPGAARLEDSRGSLRERLGG